MFVLVDTNPNSATWNYVINIDGSRVPYGTEHRKEALIESDSLSHRRHFILSGFDVGRQDTTSRAPLARAMSRLKTLVRGSLSHKTL